MQHGTTQQQTTTAPRLKRAVIFARTRALPHDDSHEHDQLRRQVDVCRRVAAYLRVEVARVYEAHGGTTDVSVRAAVEEMLHFIREHEIDYLIVQGCDRLTRTPSELIRIALWLKNAGTDLITTAETPPGHSPRRDPLLKDRSGFTAIVEVAHPIANDNLAAIPVEFARHQFIDRFYALHVATIAKEPIAVRVLNNDSQIDRGLGVATRPSLLVNQDKEIARPALPVNDARDSVVESFEGYHHGAHHFGARQAAATTPASAAR